MTAWFGISWMATMLCDVVVVVGCTIKIELHGFLLLCIHVVLFLQLWCSAWQPFGAARALLQATVADITHNTILTYPTNTIYNIILYYIRFTIFVTLMKVDRYQQKFKGKKTGQITKQIFEKMSIINRNTESSIFSCHIIHSILTSTLSILPSSWLSSFSKACIQVSIASTWGALLKNANSKNLKMFKD